MRGTDSPSDRPALVTRPALFAAGRPRASLIGWAVLLALGIYAFTNALDREGFPPVNIPIAIVEANYFVDDVDLIDAELSQPVQQAYAELEGVEAIRTFSRDNGFVAVVEFETSFSSRDGLAALLAAPAPPVPEGVELEYRPIDATKFQDTYDMVVTVIGPDGATAEELTTQAEHVSATLDELSMVELAEPLELLTESLNPATGENEVRLTSFTRYGEGGDTAAAEAIGVGLIRNEAADLDVLEFSDAIDSVLRRELALPDDYRAVIGADFADDVQRQLDALTSNLLFGLLAVAIVSLLLIGWRTAVLTAAFMATVMLTALTGMWLIGYSLNTITLFALVLTLGLLVDDAIVISESVDANRDDPAPGYKGDLGVVRRAVDRVGAASFAGTVSTLTVFAPMVFITGVLGEFIRPIPITVMLTLAVSFVLSITLIPAIGRIFLLRGTPSTSPIIRGQAALARSLGKLAGYPSGNGIKGWLTGLGLIAGAIAIVVVAMGTAGRVGFNIFPPTKDSNALQISVDYDPGISIEEAQEFQANIDEAVLEVLGEDVARYQVVSGNVRGSYTFVDLVSFDDRSTTSPSYVDQIIRATADLPGVRVAANPVDVGPPPDEFPFQVQVSFEPDAVAEAETLARELATTLPGMVLDKTTGDETRVTQAFVATEGQIWRTDGRRLLEVRAQFDTDDTTSNLTAAEELVGDLYPADDLVARGLSSDTLDFDFGLESDNQDDFASLGVALIFALVLMFVLLTLQFRSLLQPLLVFLAIPFSFFGVFTLLEQTDNSISFFVGVGFIALIGVAVNNTILLVDAANQARRDGATPGEAIARAVERRFRPLVVTTATTVAGLLPLALSDPFWEALCYTLIGGLVSSTVLVLVAFPAMYLAVETVRSATMRRAKQLIGR